MLILIDENLPPQLAEGLNILQQPMNFKLGIQCEVHSVRSLYGEGCKDEQWIPDAGKKGAVVITRDYRIQTTRHQRDLYNKYGLGLIFFNVGKGSGITYWQTVTAIISRWEAILKFAKEPKPFGYRFTMRSDKLILEPLEN